MRRREPSLDATSGPKPWRRRLAPAVAMALLALIGFRLPHWQASFRLTGMVLSDQILRVWWYELTSGKMREGARTHWIADVEAKDEMKHPAAVLAKLRAYESDSDAPTTDPVLETATDLRPLDPGWPLLAELEPNAAQTQALRQALGLPSDGPINVLMLFVESLRAYEIDDPQVGPAVFPRLRSLFGEHALYFRQAYSSSLAAGETVRGEFSTQCGMLPNVLGPATYISNATIRVHCTQELMRRSGHQTLWLSSYHSTFHSKRSFEMLHGTQLFFDQDYFLDHGVTQKVGNWGLADGPFLQEALRVLEAHAVGGAPVYANVTTISTHHPHTVVPEGPLPDWLMQATASRPAYQGYLSRLRYADSAVGAFFDALFSGPMADNTLVVVLGDHSISEAPLGDLSPVQALEAKFRIPIALVSKHARAQVLEHPVHQADVAPTLARLVGASGNVAWVGRGLLGKHGTPWIYATRAALHYRTAERGCYTLRANAAPRCFDVSGADPLRVRELPSLDETPSETAFFHEVLEANMQALAMNQIVPREGTKPVAAHASTAPVQPSPKAPPGAAAPR